MEDTKLETERFEGNYFQWIGHELKRGTDGVALAIWFFGFGFQLALYLANPITLTSTVTLLATLVGLLCTTLMMNGSPLNGLVGLISVFGFIWVNWSAGHYASVLDQVIFAICIDIPLLFTWRTYGQNLQQKIRKLTGLQWVLVIIAMAVAWFVLNWAYIKLGDTNPLWDSLVLAIGAFASLLVVFHVNASYTLWLAEDIVNVVLWATALSAGYSQSSLPMLVSVIMYLATAIYGRFFSVWSKPAK